MKSKARGSTSQSGHYQKRKKEREEGGREGEREKKITSVDEELRNWTLCILDRMSMIYYEKQYGHSSNNKKKFTILPV